jgi:hypothetical protein
MEAFGENYTRNEWRRCETTLQTSEEDVKLHSKRVENMRKDTPNIWGRCEHYTRNGWRRYENTLETSGEDMKIHSKRVGKIGASCAQAKIFSSLMFTPNPRDI